MDKNNGELWMVCPTLYKETVDKLFATTAAAEPERPVSESSSDTKEIPLDCWDKVRKEGEKGALPQRTPKKRCRWADVIKDGAEKALPQRVKKAVMQTPNTMDEPSAGESKETVAVSELTYEQNEKRYVFRHKLPQFEGSLCRSAP